MSAQISPVASVMVGNDGSAGAKAALDWARHLAAAAGAHFTVVHAGGEELPADPVPPRLGRDRYLQVTGHPTGALLDVCRDLRADFVVVGRRGGGGFRELKLGSTAHQLAEYSPVPVAVIAEDATSGDWPWPFRRIVVGVDGSVAGEAALAWTVGMAGAADAEVTVIHAVDFVPFVAASGIGEAVYRSILERREAEMERWCRGLREAGVTHNAIVSEGGAAGVILEVVNQVDSQLVVVGRRGHGGQAGLIMGSVAHRVLAFAPCPAVVVPQTEP